MGFAMSKPLVTALLLTFFAMGATIAKAAAPLPYVGQETREIKALSSEEIAAYLAGNGMGLAKAAELNHYPGPLHVLALATELALTPAQSARTEALYQTMQNEAVALGKQLIEAERQLDHMFANKTITTEKLQQSLQAIALLQGRIRQVHLQTHLAQAEILDAEQIRKYDELRGYAESSAHSTHHMHPQQH